MTGVLQPEVDHGVYGVIVSLTVLRPARHSHAAATLLALGTAKPRSCYFVMRTMAVRALFRRNMLPSVKKGVAPARVAPSGRFVSHLVRVGKGKVVVDHDDPMSAREKPGTIRGFQHLLSFPRITQQQSAHTGMAKPHLVDASVSRPSAARAIA